MDRFSPILPPPAVMPLEETMNHVTLGLALTCALALSACNKSPAPPQPVPVAVDEAKKAPAAAEEGATGAVPDKKALAAAGKLHADKPGGAGPLPAGHPQVLPAGHPPVGGNAAGGGTADQGNRRKGYVDKKVSDKIAPARGEGAVTVSQLHADRAKLKDQQVVVRGKVVKASMEIMNRNWIHLQDGSGSAEAGDHDITVTTQHTAKVGDIVTVTGKLAVDKDFGAGYKYGAIIETATIQPDAAGKADAAGKPEAASAKEGAAPGK